MVSDRRVRDERRQRSRASLRASRRHEGQGASVRSSRRGCRSSALGQDRRARHRCVFARPVMAISEALPPTGRHAGRRVAQGSGGARRCTASTASGITVGHAVGQLTRAIRRRSNPGAPNYDLRAGPRERRSCRPTRRSSTATTRRVPGQRRGPRHGADRSTTWRRVRRIAFHTAFNSELDFAEGIIELADAGANVIVDDVRLLRRAVVHRTA